MVFMKETVSGGQSGGKPSHAVKVQIIYRF